MSLEEMREQCLSLCSFQLRVEIRLKNGREVMHGRIGAVEGERFEFIGDDNVVHQLRYAWVARIKSA